jgi:hypothetical protein
MEKGMSLLSPRLKTRLREILLQAIVFPNQYE